MTQPVHQRAKKSLHTRLHQRGAALLAAMLTVTLVATFAATAMWQQWRSIEVETAERARVQSAWILVGALDWSRLILIEDHNAGGADHLAEPWAVPLEEARLSTFLAAERNVAQVEDASTDTSDAFLSGQITDLQARLNLATLLPRSGVDREQARAPFKRLFAQLGLPAGELGVLVQALAQAHGPADGNANTQTEPDPNAPLMPQGMEQLTWLGMAPATIAVLEPFVTLLPDPGTRVNLNTASAEVLMASIKGLDQAGANKIVAVRQLQPFRTLADARALLGANIQLQENLHDTRSSYFEVRGRLRLDDVTVHERSVVHRVGRTVTTLTRQRTAAVPGEVADAAPAAVRQAASLP